MVALAIRHRPAPTDWAELLNERRITLSCTSSADWYDHLVSYTNASLDAGSLRIYELDPLNGIDRAYDTRYISGLNHLAALPCVVTAGVASFTVLGRWPAGTTRRFALYWTASGGQAQPQLGYLDAVALGWTATITAGTAGDVYALVVSGTTYSYTMAGGDTATVIATALKNAINAGTIATATSAAGVVTIKTKTPRSLTFTVTTAGSTVPANVVLVAPVYFGVGRVGPDTNTFPSPATSQSLIMGLPLTLDGVHLDVQGRVGFGRTNQSQHLRLMRYRVQGDATDYTATSVAWTSLTVDGPMMTAIGTIGFAPRGGTPDWAGTITLTYRHTVATGRKSDDTSPNSFDKYLDIVRCTVVYTAQRSFTPPTGSASGTSLVNFDVLSLADGNNFFTSNVTISTANKLPNWYCPSGGSPTAYTGSTDLSGLALGTIIGGSGNAGSMGVLVKSATLSGFGSQTPSFKWFPDAVKVFGLLQLVGLSNGAVIPSGAQITLDVLYGDSWTLNASSVGDMLLPDELCSVLTHMDDVPTITVLGNEAFGANTLKKTAEKQSTQLVTGVQWMQSNALSIVGRQNAYAWSYDTKTTLPGGPDDEDGTYGEAYKLAGLVLRYLRTGDTTLLPAIDLQARYHVDIERAAVALYGSWWVGSAPYWYAWTNPVTRFFEGGLLQPGDSSQMDPNAPNYGTPTSPGNAQSGVSVQQYTINYAQGQVRASTSSDQLRMVTLALYHLLYLTRNDAAFTTATPATWHATVTAGSTGDVYRLNVNGTAYSYTQAGGDTATSIATGLAAAINAGSVYTAYAHYGTLWVTKNALTVTTTGTTTPANLAVETLRTACVNLLDRMATFETAIFAGDSTIRNAYHRCTGTSPAYSNGMTSIDSTHFSLNQSQTLSIPYNGQMYGLWEVNNQASTVINVSSNSALDNFFRSIYAPTSDVAAVIQYLLGFTRDFGVPNLGEHAMILNSGLSGFGALQRYPHGWSLRSGTNTTANYDGTGAASAGSPQFPGDTHYINVADGTTRDHLSGRAAQRMTVLCFLALFNKNAIIEIESTGSRTRPLLTIINDMAALFMATLVEPTTQCVRHAAIGWLGSGAAAPNQPGVIEGPYTGYMLFNLEVFLLLLKRLEGSFDPSTYYRYVAG